MRGNAEGRHSSGYNLLMNYILQASNFIFPMITYPYVARILNAEGMGKVSFAASVSNFFAMIATFGISTYAVRACAKVRNEREKLSRTAQELFLLNSLTTGIAGILFGAAVLFVPRLNQEAMLMFIYCVSMFLEVLGVNWLYTSLERFQYITVRSLVFKVISLVLLFLFVHDSSDYVIYGMITVFAAAGSNIVNFINSRNYIQIRPMGNYQLSGHFKITRGFFIQSVSRTLFFNMDQIMLGFLCTDYEVGIYNTAVKIKYLLSTLVSSLGVVFLPRQSHDFENGDWEAFWNTISKSIRYVCFISVPAGVFLWMEAEDVILFFCGSGFDGAAMVLRILAQVVLIIGLSTVTGIQLLTAMEKERLVSYSILAGTAVNLVLNACLIPYFGAKGAAAATLVSELAVLLVQLYHIHKMKIRLSICKKMAGSCIAAALAAAVTLGASAAAMPLAAGVMPEGGVLSLSRLIFCGIIFSGVYVGVQLVQKDEIILLILSRLKRKQKNES